MSRFTISLVINTLNAQKTLKNTILSCKWADDIVIVDMHSTDNTRAIATELGARIFDTEPCGYVEPARNYALSVARGDWIILLDADEELQGTREDVENLINLIKDEYVAAHLRRENYLGAWKINDSGWGDDPQLRLFLKGKVRWQDTIHSHPLVDGAIYKHEKDCPVWIKHKNFSNIDELIQKLNRYAKYEPAPTNSNDWKTCFLEYVTEIEKRCTPSKDGALSILLATYIAQYRLTIRAYEWERSNHYPNSDADDNNILSLLYKIGHKPTKKLHEKIVEQDAQIAEREAQIAERDRRITHLKRSIARIESSLIWRISWPLRFLHKKFDIIYKRWFKKFIIGIKIILIHYKSGVFDSRWYAQQIPNYKNLLKMPLLHFAFFGVYENRSPNPRFNRQSYEIMNPEWRKSSDSPLLDYTLHGFKQVINKFTLNSLMEKNSIDAIQKLESLLNLIGQHNNGIDTKNFSSQLKKLVTRLNSALAFKASSSSKTPKVSIIIPVYNQIYYTIVCLISLFESKQNSDFEVIIADDCSTDDTSTIFSKFSDRIRVIRTPGNLGFLKNCNHAAKEAKGEFVVLLNNDMVLLPDWLDSLVDTISKDSECGMVGSKLLNLDGTLQEAGGIFWNDGSAWNYGRGQNPMAPEFNYKKEVDYCSGASICLRKEVWDAVGGFDELFAPAYCEEADLAFRLRARGLKTIYQPRSVGIHLEGVSCGKDTAQGIKAYQVQNLKKLRDRWSDILKKEHFPNADQVFLARDRSAKKRHMLFVDHYLPRPDFDAGSKQMATYLQVFVEMGFQITFWPDNLLYDREYALPLEELGIEVISCNGGSITFEEWIKKNGQHLDVAFLSRPHVALRYIQRLKENSKALIVFYGHDIHSLRTKGELEFNPADQALLARLANEEEEETKCWEKCDRILYPSIEEKNYISEKFPLVNVDILPLYCKADEEILAAKTRTEFDKRSGILFVGGFNHSPNKDGILWFCNQILPLIRKILPTLSLTIAGSNPPEEVKRLENDFIKVTGRVSDQQLADFYENHRVAIAPLRFGGGVKGKVVESMLKGLPMVTTKVGSQGLKTAGNDLAIANSECEFADKVIELLKDEKKWLQQRYSGETFFVENFSSTKIKDKLQILFQ